MAKEPLTPEPVTNEAPQAAEEVAATNGEPAPTGEASKPTRSKAKSPTEYTASIFPGSKGMIPTPFAEAVLALETSIARPVWLLIEASRPPHDEIVPAMTRAFFGERDKIQACPAGAALVIDSYGGDAGSAYKIATLFRRHCGEFAAVVPRMAKSAATLLTLGASEIYLGADAELGPLDAQLWDMDREEYSSALDEVQALERLNSVALDFVDQAMFLLVNRTGKKTEILLPPVLHFAAELTQPLLAKIDTVHYTQMSRLLKVAEDYATRLLQPCYPKGRAEEIARHFVNAYSEHGFVIDREELEDHLTNTLADADSDTQDAINELERMLTERPRSFAALGRVERRDAKP